MTGSAHFFGQRIKAYDVDRGNPQVTPEVQFSVGGSPFKCTVVFIYLLLRSTYDIRQCGKITDIRSGSFGTYEFSLPGFLTN